MTQKEKADRFQALHQSKDVLLFPNPWDGGSARREAVEAAMRGVGGRLESFHYAFGDVDAYLIADLPDNVTATALAMAVNVSGSVRIKTVPLMTVEEVDQAVTKSVNYRPPGQ